MTSQTTVDTNDGNSMFFVSINPSAPTTIVFLHGLSTSYREYDRVSCYLQSHSNYHILIPDLPAHSRSSHIPPCTIPVQALLVTSLIKLHARNARAHVVGISMGGFIAQYLASTDPQLIQSLFVTGCAPFEGWRLWLSQHPAITAAGDAMYRHLPFWLRRKINPVEDDVPQEVRDDVAKNGGPEVIKVVLASIAADVGEDLIQALGQGGIDVCAVAGGLQDNIEATRRQGRLLRGKSPHSRSRAMVLPQGTHGWATQFPELFSKAVIAWIEGKDLPEELQEIM